MRGGGVLSDAIATLSAAVERCRDLRWQTWLDYETDRITE